MSIRETSAKDSQDGEKWDSASECGEWCGKR